MKSPFFLATRKDYEDWDKLISHCDGIDGLTKPETKAAKDAFRFLKSELGNKFLSEAAAEKHPFFETPRDKGVLFSGTKYSYIGTITNEAPWTRKWITWLADALKKIKYQHNYSSLIKRIKNKNQYIEGLSVLDIAYRLARVGFTVSIDPDIFVRGIAKKPDMRITDQHSKAKFYVEVSTNTVDSKTVRNMQTMSSFDDLIMTNYPTIVYSGIIHRDLAKKHLDEIVEKTKMAIKKCTDDDSFQELFEEHVVELGLTTSEHDPDFKNWCSKRGLQPHQLYMPTTETNQINRIIRLISKEQQQVPNECPNIIVLRNDYLFFKRTPMSVIRELEEEVFKYPHILMTIIYGVSMFSSGNVLGEYGYHLYIRKRYFGILNYEFLILYNRFCDFDVSKTTTTKIFNAFKKY